MAMARDALLTGIRAVLLDMDGTLVDSTEAAESIWTAWSRRNGIVPADVLAYCHGRDVASTVTHFLPQLCQEEVRAMVADQLDAECTQLDTVRSVTGGHELVGWLEGRSMAWGVVTNAPRRLALARLGAAGFAPSLLVAFEDVEHGKPAPDGYIQGSQRCGAVPAQTLAVEDSEPGLAAARAAGTVVAAVGGRTDADLVCHDLHDLRNRLTGAIQ